MYITYKLQIYYFRNKCNYFTFFYRMGRKEGRAGGREGRRVKRDEGRKGEDRKGGKKGEEG